VDVIVMPIGSHGDLHPFLGIATALRRRGHAVKFIANGYYESLVRALGLEFVPLGTAEEFLAVARDPDIWHWRRGMNMIGQTMIEAIPACHRAIMEHAVVGKTVLVYSTLAFGARLAQETLGLSGVSVHLSPAVFSSDYESPKLPGIPAWLPRPAKRIAIHLAHLVADRIFGRPLNAYRKQLNLPPVRNFLRDWCHSPQRVIGLFPSWYAAPQPDWPKQTVLTDFPLFDEKEVTPLPEEVARFLDAGSPPIVFTPGSAMFQGQRFFAAAVEACGILNRRGLLLTRHAEQVPRDLPSGVIHAAYAPFSQLLPRSAALVHHGGIGSTAQAMAAGVPQLMMPMGYDQPDNALRVRRLGVGDWLSRRQFTGRRVARKLDSLLSRAIACRAVAEKFDKASDPVAETVRWIESIGDVPTFSRGASSR
jgi:rhamnosyltransferase subunit B